MSDEFVTVANFDKRGEADVCKIVLEQDGIPAFIADDNLVGGIFYGFAVGGIKVQVSATAADRAAALLEGFKRHGFSEPPTSFDDAADSIRFACEHCGASLAISSIHKGSVLNCPHCDEYIDVPQL